MSKLTYLAIVILVLVLAMPACNLPTRAEPQREQEITATQTPSQPAPAVETASPTATRLIEATTTSLLDVNFEGVHFSFDKTLAEGILPARVPANAPDAPEWDIHPDYLEFKFGDYILADVFHEPAIRIYPVESYRQISPAAANTIQALNDFLNRCPINPQNLPFLPLWNAAQIMYAKYTCLEFHNGNGIRFLTQYGQAANPINNHEIFYTFQGLTKDGWYYISAVLPVSHPALPADSSNPPGGDWVSFSETFTVYIEEIKQQLNGTADDSFSPPLNLLDEMIRTLEVN